MTTIEAGSSPVTLINTCTVVPERQEELVSALREVIEKTMRGRPGFVSANLHASLDGTRVLNYAQWDTRSDFENMLADPEARAHMEKVAAIATTAEPQLYRVTHVYQD